MAKSALNLLNYKNSISNFDNVKHEIYKYLNWQLRPMTLLSLQYYKEIYNTKFNHIQKDLRSANLILACDFHVCI